MLGYLWARLGLTSRARADKSIYPAARRQSLGAGVAQLVERVLAKHKVVGSKPITRSSILFAVRHT